MWRQQRLGGATEGNECGICRIRYLKGFYEENSKSMLHSRETLITESGFSLKPVKYRLDRQSYRYWKETTGGGLFLDLGREIDTQGVGWSDVMTLERTLILSWPPPCSPLPPTAHRWDCEE